MEYLSILCRYMPSTLIALEPLATLLAAYRLTLALQLGRQVGNRKNYEQDNQTAPQSDPSSRTPSYF